MFESVKGVDYQLSQRMGNQVDHAVRAATRARPLGGGSELEMPEKKKQARLQDLIREYWEGHQESKAAGKSQEVADAELAVPREA